MVVPKALFSEIGSFDLSFFSAASEDRELCSRWVLNRHKIVYDSKLLVYHSHHLTMRSFIHQHFSYGRGAFCFRKLQRAKGWGYFCQEIGFHLNIENWLLYPLRSKEKSAGTLAILLLVWQFANAFGFVWQALVAFFTANKESSS